VAKSFRVKHFPAHDINALDRANKFLEHLVKSMLGTDSYISGSFRNDKSI
tara:strand:+ start:8 stop:157 length:150 start_codon:yes stop_codon:yes gene_type:complete